MDEKKLLKELANLGFECAIEKCTKNRATLTGVRIVKHNGGVSPMLYIEKFSGKDEAEIAGQMAKIFKATELSEDFDFEKILTKENVLKNAVIVLASEETVPENAVRFESPFEGISTVPAFTVDIAEEKSGIVRIQKSMLGELGITEVELMKAAMKNTECDFNFKTVSFFGVSLHYVTNTRECNGASSVLCKDKMAEVISEKFGEAVIAIPSSVHEFLLVPCEMVEECTNVAEELKNIISAVNRDEVLPEEQLGDQAYVVALNGKEVQYFTADEYFKDKAIDER